MNTILILISTVSQLASAAEHKCQGGVARRLQSQSRSAEVISTTKLPDLETLERKMVEVIKDGDLVKKETPQKNKALIARLRSLRANRTAKSAFEDWIIGNESPPIHEVLEFRRGDTRVRAGVEDGRIKTVLIGDDAEKLEVLRFDVSCQLTNVTTNSYTTVTPSFCTAKVLAEAVDLAEEAKSEITPKTDAEACKFQCGSWTGTKCECPGAKVDKDYKFEMHPSESSCCPIRRLTYRELLTKLADKHASTVDSDKIEIALESCNKYFVNKNQEPRPDNGVQPKAKR